MKNNNIFETHKEEILSIFKQNYQKLVSQSLDLKFERVLFITLDELKIEGHSADSTRYLEHWFNNIHNQEFIAAIINNHRFQEIIFHDASNVQIILNGERKNIILENISDEDYQLALEIYSIKNNQSWNYSEPFVSFQAKINDRNCRLSLVHFSTSASKTSKVFIRSINSMPLSIESFNGSVELNEFIQSITAAKKNIIIAGSTGCGKTTFLRSLLSSTDSEEHVIILEDTNEIFTTSAKQTSMLAKEKTGKKSLKEYCAYALRMSPDRLILGEMRSDEVVPFLLAMNTGHNGLMSTIHANSSVDAISRLSLLFSMYSGNSDMSFELITKLICKNIDYIIYLKDKSISEVCRIIGSEGDIPFFEKIYEKSIST